MSDRNTSRDSTISYLEKVEALNHLNDYTRQVDSLKSSNLTQQEDELSSPASSPPPIPSRHPERKLIRMSSSRKQIPQEWIDSVGYDRSEASRHHSTGPFPSYDHHRDPFATPARSTYAPSQYSDTETDDTPTPTKLDLAVPDPISPLKVLKKQPSSRPSLVHHLSNLSLRSASVGLGISTPSDQEYNQHAAALPRRVQSNQTLSVTTSPKKVTGLRKAKRNSEDSWKLFHSPVEADEDPHFTWSAKGSAEASHRSSTFRNSRTSSTIRVFPRIEEIGRWRDAQHPYLKAHNRIVERLEYLHHRAAQVPIPTSPELLNFAFQNRQMQGSDTMSPTASFGSGTKTLSFSGMNSAETSFGSMGASVTSLALGQELSSRSPDRLTFNSTDRAESYRITGSADAGPLSPLEVAFNLTKRRNTERDNKIIDSARQNPFTDKTGQVSRRVIAEAVFLEVNAAVGIQSDGIWMPFEDDMRKDIARVDALWKGQDAKTAERNVIREILMGFRGPLTYSTRTTLPKKLTAINQYLAKQEEESRLPQSHYECAFALRWLNWAEEWEQREEAAHKAKYEKDKTEWIQHLQDIEQKETERRRVAYETSMNATKEDRERLHEQERARDEAIKAAEQGKRVYLDADAQLKMKLREKRRSVMSTLLAVQLQQGWALEEEAIAEGKRMAKEEAEIAARKKSNSDAEQAQLQAVMQARKEKVLEAMMARSQDRSSSQTNGGEDSGKPEDRKSSMSQAVADYYHRTTSKISNEGMKVPSLRSKGSFRKSNGSWMTQISARDADEMKESIRDSLNSQNSSTSHLLSSDGRPRKSSSLRQTQAHYTMPVLADRLSQVSATSSTASNQIATLRSDISHRSSDDSFNTWKSKRDKHGRLLEPRKESTSGRPPTLNASRSFSGPSTTEMTPPSPAFIPEIYQAAGVGNEEKDAWEMALGNMDYRPEREKLKRNAIMVNKDSPEVSQGLGAGLEERKATGDGQEANSNRLRPVVEAYRSGISNPFADPPSPTGTVRRLPET